MPLTLRDSEAPHVGAGRRPGAIDATATMHAPRAGSGRRARWPWPALASAVLLAACGGGGEPGPPPPGGRAGALAVSAPGELLAYARERLRQRAAGSGAQGPGSGPAGFDPVPAAGVAVAGATSFSSTLLQEGGVDEPDLLHTDGRFLYTLLPASLDGGTGAGQVLRAYGRDEQGRALPRAVLELPAHGASSSTDAGMLFDSKRSSLTVISQRWVRDRNNDCVGICTTIWPGYTIPSVQVQRVSLADPALPVAGDTLVLQGRLVAARRVADTLVLVSTHTPVLPFDRLPGDATPAQREAAIAALGAADLLPRISRNGGADVPALGETDCWVQPGNASLSVQITTLTRIDLADPRLPAVSRCFLGGTEALYMTPQSLYLATTRFVYRPGPNGAVFPTDMRTDIHQFAVTPAAIDWRASGDVPGHLGWDRELTSFRLSEHEGALRVLSFTGSVGWTTADATGGNPPSPAQLTVLRASGNTLQAVGSLPNAQRPAAIGKPGEQLYAVRFLADRAYAVTFRQTDPLYVLDLANPSDPRIAGELELPGFSNQLVPVGPGMLLGVGKDADAATGRQTGVKVALFDVRDPARPALAGSFSMGVGGSSSAADFSRHGIGVFERNGVARVGLPVLIYAADAQGNVNWGQPQRGLQRFEVDLAARALRKGALLAGAGNPQLQALPLSVERSVQIEDTLHYLNGAGLVSERW